MRRLSATALKWIAVITMLVDHTTVCFLERVSGSREGVYSHYSLAQASQGLHVLDRVGRAVGRQAFPIFAFFIVEGFFFTRSRWKYLGRLSLFTVISELPFYLLNYTGPVGSRYQRSINVYATLALGLIAIWAIDTLFMRKYLEPGVADGSKSHRDMEMVLRALLGAAVVFGICWFAWRINTDYDYIGIIAIVLFYCFRELFPLHTWRPYACLAVWLWMGCNNGYEWYALPSFLLLAFCYNGERGGSVKHKTAEKYFFYIFYPAHLMILWLIRRAVFGY